MKDVRCVLEVVLKVLEVVLYMLEVVDDLRRLIWVMEVMLCMLFYILGAEKEVR